MGCWGDLSNSILRPEILHGTLYMPKEWENEAWYLIFNKTIFLTHPNWHAQLAHANQEADLRSVTLMTNKVELRWKQ